MSIHVKLNAEALDSLNKQKRKTTLLSVVFSLLAVTLIAVLLGLFLIPT